MSLQVALVDVSSDAGVELGVELMSGVPRRGDLVRVGGLTYEVVRIIWTPRGGHDLEVELTSIR